MTDFKSEDDRNAALFQAASDFTDLGLRNKLRQQKGRNEQSLVIHIAEKLTARFGVAVSRQQVYDLVAEAVDREMIQLSPPLHIALAKRLTKLFPKFAPKSVHVVNVPDRTDGRSASEHVSAVGAGLVRDLISNIWADHPEVQKCVRIGIGPGRATRDFCKHLAQSIRGDAVSVPLEMVAITAGGDVHYPRFASSSFSSLFDDSHNVSFVGLFGASLIPADQLEETFKRPGVSEAHALKDKIDIVVTAMGDPEDPHDLYTSYLKQAESSVPKQCRGNVQYRGYDDEKPIIEKGRQLRPIGLFELSDFREMATKENREVILFARCCGACGKSHAKALLPLLRSPKLKVWSHLVLDVPTASEVLELAAATPPD